MHSKKIIFLSLCFFFSGVATAQSWQQVKDSMFAAFNHNDKAAIIKFAAPIQQELFNPGKKDKNYQADIYFMLGTAYSEFGQFHLAEKLLLTASGSFNKSKKLSDYSIACNNLGNLYLR